MGLWRTGRAAVGKVWGGGRNGGKLWCVWDLQCSWGLGEISRARALLAPLQMAMKGHTPQKQGQLWPVLSPPARLASQPCPPATRYTWSAHSLTLLLVLHLAPHLASARTSILYPFHTHIPFIHTHTHPYIHTTPSLAFTQHPPCVHRHTLCSLPYTLTQDLHPYSHKQNTCPYVHVHIRTQNSLHKLRPPSYPQQPPCAHACAHTHTSTHPLCSPLHSCQLGGVLQRG